MTSLPFGLGRKVCIGGQHADEELIKLTDLDTRGLASHSAQRPTNTTSMVILAQNDKGKTKN